MKHEQHSLHMLANDFLRDVRNLLHRVRAEDDLPARICEHFKGNPRLTVLRFPAINRPGEVGYNPLLPQGALVPELKSLGFLGSIYSDEGPWKTERKRTTTIKADE